MKREAWVPRAAHASTLVLAPVLGPFLASGLEAQPLRAGGVDRFSSSFGCRPQLSRSHHVRIPASILLPGGCSPASDGSDGVTRGGPVGELHLRRLSVRDANGYGGMTRGQWRGAPADSGRHEVNWERVGGEAHRLQPVGLG